MRQPLYREIASQLRDEIQDGRLPEGGKLPPEPELAKKYGVSRPTLREALGALEREGFITKVHGIGSFIRRQDGHIQAGLENLESYTDTIRRQGYEAEDRVLDVIESTLEEAGLAEFGPADSHVLTIESLRLADGQPVIYCRDVLLPRFASATDAKAVLRARSKVESLLDFLQSELGCWVSHGQLSVQALPATEQVAAQLGVEEGCPVLCLSGPSFDSQGEPVYHSTNYFRTDLYSFSFVRRRIS